MNINTAKSVFIFLSGIFFTAFSCTSPASISETDVITVSVPEYDQNYLPLLLSYKIIISNEDETKVFYENSEATSFKITLPKEKLTSILIYPVTKTEFFLPAGCIYPYDLYSYKEKLICTPSWSSGTACIILSDLLTSFDRNEIEAASKFNWKKLEENLSKKDSDAFSNFDSLKTKKCTTANCLKKDILKSKILYPDSSISLSYYDTKSIFADNVKDEEISKDTKIFCEYIPLNYFYKEKGWITFQKNSENKTAFLLNDKIVYLSK